MGKIRTKIDEFILKDIYNGFQNEIIDMLSQRYDIDINYIETLGEPRRIKIEVFEHREMQECKAEPIR